MTKEEFLQEAVLRMFGSHPYMYIDTIISKSKDLTEAFFNATEQQEQESASSDDYLSRSIQEVIDKVDMFDKDAYYPFGRGFGTRLNKICRRNNIASVRDLINIGRRNFIRYHFVGRGLIWNVDAALKNLYGIEEW